MRAKGQWFAVVTIVVLLVTTLVLGVALTPEVRQVGVGSKAPDFRAVNLATGDTLGLADYRGEVVLLNVWATWCAPCEAEMPAMQRLHDELSPHGLRVVAVSVDIGSSEKVDAWAAERGLTFEILHDPAGRIERLYQTTGVPESFVIDRQGTIVKKVIGALEWDAPAQQTIFRELLGLDHAEVAGSTP
jgi:peroxiredoxin